MKPFLDKYSAIGRVHPDRIFELCLPDWTVTVTSTYILLLNAKLLTYVVTVIYSILHEFTSQKISYFQTKTPNSTL